MIRSENISLIINNKTILKDINIVIENGFLTSIVGPNGAGKSSLLKCLTGLLPSSKGQVFLNDKPLNSYSIKELSLKRAVLAQSNFINFPFSTFDIVMMGRNPYFETMSKKENEKIAKECLNLLDISHLSERFYFTLSGGEQQRVQIARVLAQVFRLEKAFLFLDEPSNFLDLKHQHKLFLELNNLQKKYNLAIFLIIHNLQFAKHYTHKTVLMKNAEVFSFGESSKVLSKNNVSEVFEISPNLFF